MMWAATVRRCPTGHRHPSQFGARLQLARALTHAPYLICDGVYSCPTPIHNHLNHDFNLPYRLSYDDSSTINDSNVICEHFVDCDRQNPGRNTQHSNRNSCNQEAFASTRNYRDENTPRSIPSGSSYTSRNRFDVDEVRVELPYSRRELESEDDYSLNDRIVRRYDDIQGREDLGDEGIVGLSYQQRSLGEPGPYRGEVWGAEPSIDCWGDRPLLLKRGKTRELVRTLFVVALSFTLVTFVIMGFEMYNMLITTIFLFFLLSSMTLLIFLLLRKPTCFPCCCESEAVEESEVQEQRREPIPSETSDNILKKRLSDSPPPYESPPDYNSLPPEILVNARGLSGLETTTSENVLTRVHGEQPMQSYCSQQKQNAKRTQRSRMSFNSRSSPFLSTSSLSSKLSPTRYSLPTSPSLCTSSGILRATYQKGQNLASVPKNLSSSSSSSSPPPYDCVVSQTETTKKEKPC